MGKISREEIKEKVMELVRKQITINRVGAGFNVDIEEASDLYSDLGFDSVELMDFVAELEKGFCIAIDANDFLNIKTIKQLIDKLDSLMGN